MRRLIISAAVAGAMTLPAAAREDCGSAPDQLHATECAHRNWGEADAELNRLWGVVKPVADARGTGAALLYEQRGWLTRRDATCEAERATWEGGSIAPMVYWNCMERMTRERSGELEAMR